MQMDKKNELLKKELKNLIFSEPSCSLSANFISMSFYVLNILLLLYQVIVEFSITNALLLVGCLFIYGIFFIAIGIEKIVIFMGITGIPYLTFLQIEWTDPLTNRPNTFNDWLIVLTHNWTGVLALLLSLLISIYLTFSVFIGILSSLDLFILKKVNKNLIKLLFLIRDFRQYLVGVFDKIFDAKEQKNLQSYNKLFFEIYVQLQEEMEKKYHHDNQEYYESYESYSEYYDEREEDFCIKKCDSCGTDNKFYISKSDSGIFKCLKCEKIINIYNYTEKNTDENYYFELLDIEPTLDLNELKSAYRKMLSKYHPDKVSHLGHEFTDMAHKKTLDIRNAYDQLVIILKNS